MCCSMSYGGVPLIVVYLLRYDPKIEIPASRAVASRPLNPDQDGPDAQFVFTYATRGMVLLHPSLKFYFIDQTIFNFIAHLMAADIISNPNAPSLPKLAKLANAKNPIVLEDEDEHEDEAERETAGGRESTGAGGNPSTPVPPRTSSKRPRNVRSNNSTPHT